MCAFKPRGSLSLFRHGELISTNIFKRAYGPRQGLLAYEWDVAGLQPNKWLLPSAFAGASFTQIMGSPELHRGCVGGLSSQAFCLTSLRKNGGGFFQTLELRWLPHGDYAKILPWWCLMDTKLHGYIQKYLTPARSGAFCYCLGKQRHVMNTIPNG